MNDVFVLWYLRICYLRICYKPTLQHTERIHWRRERMPNPVRCWSCSANLIVGCWSCTTQWKDNAINTWFVREFDSRLLHKREHRHPDLILGERWWFTTQWHVDVWFAFITFAFVTFVFVTLKSDDAQSSEMLKLLNPVGCWSYTTQWKDNSINTWLVREFDSRLLHKEENIVIPI